MGVQPQMYEGWGATAYTEAAAAMGKKHDRQVGENWRCPVCSGGIQLSTDLYLAAQEGEAALRQEAKRDLTCSLGHKLQLSETQQQDLVMRLSAEWTLKGRAQA